MIKLKLTKKQKSNFTTLLGFLSAVCTALAVIDFDNFDLSRKADIAKLLVVIMPAIAGYMTTLKDDEEKEK